MATRTYKRKLTEAERNAPDLDDAGDLDVEHYPIPDGSALGIKDKHLREVWDGALALITGEKPRSKPKIGRNRRTQVSVNNFRPRKFEDHEIVDGDNLVVGHIRVKPSGILWAPANSKVWHGVSLTTFAAFMEEHGKKQKK